MDWIAEVRARVTAAMRERDELTKSILRVVLGDLQATESRQNGRLTQEQGAQVVRKLIKSNEETIGLTADAATKQRLEAENRVLAALLPQTLSVDDIIEALDPVVPQIRAAGNDGQATGVAMKHLKSAGAVVEGKDVAAAVKQLRA
jgi:uncharacterized protein YqeY